MNNKTVIAVICLFNVLTPGLAEITTDGTVGSEGQLSGPQFQIGQELGSLSGNNLFHSFGRFNLNSSESATFTGNNQIQNVISRVTGGALSTIDGTLKSEIGSAAFYFINPAGIVFGQHAQIDVPGAFYASTAGELRFADGTAFSAEHPQANTLSMAAPETFGFLGKQTGAIALNGAELVFNPGAAVQFNAAKITMANASLTGEGMDLQLASVGTEKQDVGVASLPEHALSGAISINDTVLDASGNGKGRIAMRAGDVEAVNSQINANNIGNLDMPANQGIDIQVGSFSLDNAKIISFAGSEGKAGNINVSVQKDLTAINGGLVASLTSVKGDAGSVIVEARKILIDSKISQKATGVASVTNSGSGGNAGTVNVIAQKELTLLNGGLITTSTLGNGDAGEVIVKAENLRIDSDKSEFATGIFSDAYIGSSGKAGTVNVSVEKELALVNGGGITSVTQGQDNAGNVNVNAGKILIDRQRSGSATGILSDALKGSNGNAGAVNVIALKELIVLNGGRVSSLTESKGNAGEVMVEAGKILIDSRDSKKATGIVSDANEDSSGNAGTVYVIAHKELTVLNGGRVSSVVLGKGYGGNVIVKAGNLLIDGQNTNLGSGISSGAYSSQSGNAGSVYVNVQKKLTILNDAVITSATFGKGNAGTVRVNAETIQISNLNDSPVITGISSGSINNATGNPGAVNVTALKSISMNTGNINISSDKFSENPVNTNARLTVTTPQLILSNNSHISAESFGTLPASPIEIKTSRLSMDNSSITTAANQGNGGPITINANDWVQLKNSLITTSVANIQESFGTNIGNGGDITLNTDVLVMDTGFIQANTNAKNASGGNINLNVKQLVASSGNLQSGGNTPLTFIPNSGFNVIQAAAPDGINGNITNTAPQLNIVGALAGLNTPQLDLNRVGHDPCSSTVQQSTMKKLGKGGIPYFNKGQDSYTIDRLLPKKQDNPSQTTYISKAKPDIHDCQPKTKHPQPQDVTKQAG